MVSHNIFSTIFIIPILNLLIVFYKAYLSVHLPYAFGLAIVTLTVGVRLLLHPFFKQQLNTTKKMQELKPQLDKLTEKYKKDPKKLQAEQIRLYQEAGINPAAGCLFLIVQIPIFIGLYQTLSLFFVNKGMEKAIASINSALYTSSLKISTIDLSFFGFNLAHTPGKAGGIALLIPLITALLQYLQVQFATPPMPKDEKKIIKEGDKKSDTAGDFQKTLNMQMKYIFPLMIGFFSFQFPIGLSLYWNIFSIFSIIQYRRTLK